MERTDRQIKLFPKPKKNEERFEAWTQQNEGTLYCYCLCYAHSHIFLLLSIND